MCMLAVLSEDVVQLREETTRLGTENTQLAWGQKQLAERMTKLTEELKGKSFGTLYHMVVLWSNCVRRCSCQGQCP